MFRLTQLSPLVHRVWHDPSEGFDRVVDPALTAWALERGADAGNTRTLATLGEVQRELPDGLPTLLHFGRDEAGVRIEIALEPGERLYGAYDSDMQSFDRRGDHVHLVTELHGQRAHLHGGAASCPHCSETVGAARAAAERAARAAGGPDGTESGAEGSSFYSELILPWYMSSAGYGIFVSNMTSCGVLDLGATAHDRVSFSSPAGEADIYLVGPAAFRDLLQHYSELTGTQPLPPHWALGYMQSRFGYESFDHALAVARRFEREQLPLHSIVFDVYWLQDHVNLSWNPDGFAEPRAHLAELASLGARTVVITEPGTRDDASNFDDGKRSGAFAQAADGSPYANNQWYCRGMPGYRPLRPTSGGIVNFYSDAAADWWYAQHIPLIGQGVDAWWLDLNEPEDVDDDIVFPDVDFPQPAPQISGQAARNVFCLAQQRAMAERDERHSDRRPLLLSRAACSGSQRYGTVPWSGDIGATWHDMRQQVRLMLTAGMCGIPLFSCDVGGFHGEPGGELYARWMQWGAFMPVYRAHGAMSDREPWSQGDDALQALRPALQMRALLLPSLYSWTRDALVEGLPLVRALALEFPDDDRFAACEDQWLIGPLLVAPVLEQGATKRVVELPAGEWYDAWTGAPVEGPRTLNVNVGPGDIPVFARAGSAVTLDPDPLSRRSYNWPPDRLEVLSFPDSRGYAETTVYVDDGVTRNYRDDVYCLAHVDITTAGARVHRLAGTHDLPAVALTAHNGFTDALQAWPVARS